MAPIDPNLAESGIGSVAGINSIAVFAFWIIVRNLKVFVKLSQTQWERNTDGRLTKIDGVIEDLKKESTERKNDFLELKKSLTQSLVKIEGQVEQIVKVIPVIAAIKGFVETTNRRLTELEKLKTEVIELSKEVRLVRDKKD